MRFQRIDPKSAKHFITQFSKKNLKIFWKDFFLQIPDQSDQSDDRKRSKWAGVRSDFLNFSSIRPDPRETTSFILRVFSSRDNSGSWLAQLENPAILRSSVFGRFIFSDSKSRYFKGLRPIFEVILLFSSEGGRWMTQLAPAYANCLLRKNITIPSHSRISVQQKFFKTRSLTKLRT